MPMTRTTCTRLMMAREERGLSQSALAKMLYRLNVPGCSQGQISAWENPELSTTMKDGQLRHVAILLGVSVDWLLNIPGAPKAPQ